MEARAKPKQTEAHLRDGLANYLKSRGFVVWTEYKVDDGYCDIVAGTRLRSQLIVEVKARDPIRGIGQLFAYRFGLRNPTMVLAVPHALKFDPLVFSACEEADVELWLLDETGKPSRFLQSNRPKYNAKAIPDWVQDKPTAYESAGHIQD